MADGNITHLRRDPVFREASHPQAPAGSYGYPAPEAADCIEITAGHTRVWAVRIDGAIYAEFATATNAIRCREHLIGLLRLGALPQPWRAPEPPAAA